MTSVFPRMGWMILSAVGAAALGFLFDMLRRIGGVIGLAIGFVIDFIYLPWMMPAIFNVADIAITAAAVTFGILVLLNVGLDGTR